MLRRTPHRTPLKRVSQGSLFALSRSGNNPDAPHGLGFIEPVMAELIDEVETLQANVEGLRNLSNSLKTFNGSFASWLYVMDMNALTVDWPQAPTDASFRLAKRRREFMMDSDERGIKLIEIIRPPDLNQARVNKCLIALVNRKIVQKENSTGTVLYHWTRLS
ncbi:hypothetical protein BDR07DRAFT_1612980 [Suillus spraguei]|nr:hypothetical protein BDR07DRAFT_1612980 [Suillus spraguei]